MRLDNKNRPIFDLKSSAVEFAKLIQDESDWIGCVPDSIYTKVLNNIDDWILGSRENHIIAEAFGVSLGLKKPCVMIQNSGLGLALDALLGTFSLYKKGLLLVVTNRGVLDWEEAQHKEWGKCTTDILDALEFPYFNFNELGVDSIKDAAFCAFHENKIATLLIERGNIDEI